MWSSLWAHPPTRATSRRGFAWGRRRARACPPSARPGGNQFGVDLYTNYLPRLSINASGQVTIGTGATFGGSQFEVQGAGDYYGACFTGGSGADGIVSNGGADNSSSGEGFGGYGSVSEGGQAESTYAYGGFGGVFEGGAAYSSNAGGEGG